MRLRLLSLAILMGVIFKTGPFKAHAQKKDKTFNKVEQSLDTRAIRTRTNELFTRFIGNLEEVADGIFLSTTDPALANRSLIWKISAASAAQHAFFDNDPIIAVLDAYAFAEQQRQFFLNGAGNDLFKDHQKEVLQLSNDIHMDVEEIILKSCEEVDTSCEILTSINQWATKNKIESLYYNRRSIIEDMADLPGAFKHGIGKSMVEMAESVQDMSSRMNILSQTLPKQMRWEMQLVLMHLEMKKMMDSTMSTMGVMATVGQSIPKQIDSLQSISMLQMDAIRKNMTDAMSVERLEMQDWAMLYSDSIAQIALRESERWGRLINDQRELATLDANNMINSSSQPMKEVIDHLFWKGLLLIIITAILFVFASILISRLKN